MKNKEALSYRSLAAGMGQAVAERTVLRRKENGEFENWGDVADRVAWGNALLVRSYDQAIHDTQSEYQLLRRHIANGNILMSGRHLQHGDETQPMRGMECFTNCSTSSTSFGLFYLLLNGSGVGRSYSDDSVLIDWDFAPTIRVVLDSSHPDFDYSAHESLRDAKHKYSGVKDTLWFEVPDSREGWAKALELWENAAFEKIHKDKMLILDFSKVRPRGSKIMGMQGRMSSGPCPLMNSFLKSSSLKGGHLARWKQAMYIDHYFAECVLVGGARRAARMSTKHWTDKSIFDFINIKRPIEFTGMRADETLEYRKNNPNNLGFLWSSNNSVAVDEDFWRLQARSEKSEIARHAKKVFRTVCECAYADGTGEPGFINVHKLVQNSDGWVDLNRGDYVGSKKYQVNDDTQILMSKLAKRAQKQKFTHITNPCVPGDTPILTRDGYRPIVELVGQEVEIWNGAQWSKVAPFATGINPIIEVTLSDGGRLQCTPYHEWILKQGEYRNLTPKRVKAKDLQVGDKLFKFSMPVIRGGVEYEVDAYSQGFYSGDGNTDYEWSSVYDTKYACIGRLIGSFGKEQNAVARKTWDHGKMLEKSFVPINGSIDYCLNWLAGVLDADGAVTRDKNGNGLQLSSIDFNFLADVKLMLSRMGVCAKVVDGHKEGDKDIKGTVYHCQQMYRLLIGNADTYHLVMNLGLKTERLKIHGNPPQRDARQFVTVRRVVDLGMSVPTYCFTEPLSNRGTFNGIVAGQCGEISLNVLSGFCVISDVVPFHCNSIDEAEEAFRVTTRALMRVNLMDSIYKKEVTRTNRIGVGITGIHEFAYKFFGYGFRDLIDEEKSKDFWLTLARFNRAVYDEAVSYSKELGTKIPHTMTTIKPAGTTSKLFLLTEGWHLPSMREFVRWVQFRSDDPLVQTYKDNGYPSRDLVQYQGTTIIGFPTAPAITKLGMGDKLVTAGEATIEEQFKWLMLGEKYWIHGTDDNGELVKEDYGNQISFTAKFLPDKIDLADFKKIILKYQPHVRCCSIMPQAETSSYEYQPEQAVTKAEYEYILNKIKDLDVAEDVGREHLDCATGACPIDFKESK